MKINLISFSKSLLALMLVDIFIYFGPFYIFSSHTTAFNADFGILLVPIILLLVATLLTLPWNTHQSKTTHHILNFLYFLFLISNILAGIAHANDIDFLLWGHPSEPPLIYFVAMLHLAIPIYIFVKIILDNFNNNFKMVRKKN